MIVDTRQLRIVALALATACTFGSPGGKGSAGSSLGSGDDDGGTASTPGDDGMMGTDGASTGTGASGQTGDGEPTTSPVDPDASDESTMSATPSSTDDGEPPTTGSDGPVDPTTSGPPSTDDGGTGPGYPACPSGEDSECGAGNNCVPVLDTWNDITATVCGEGGCNSGADCDPPSSGNAEPTCVPLSIDTCILDCGGGATCPNGMTCTSTSLGYVCVWE